MKITGIKTVTMDADLIALIAGDGSLSEKALAEHAKACKECLAKLNKQKPKKKQ